MDRIRNLLAARVPAAAARPLGAATPCAPGVQHKPGGGVAMYLWLAALTSLVTLVALVLGGPTVSAQTPTEETLLTNLTGGINNSSTNCPIAQAFTTGPASAAIIEVSTRGQATTSIEIRADDSGNPAASALYTMTNFSTSGGNRVFTAAADTNLAASTTYWVLANGTSCLARNAAPSVHPTWTAGLTKFQVGTTWFTWSNWWFAVEIKGTIHTGTAHDPESSASSASKVYPRVVQGVTPKPFCNSRGLDPSGGTECYWRTYEEIPISDPCNQPWEVPGSYRRDRGCLNRY